VDVVSTGVEVFCIADAVVDEASLPDWEFGGEAVGETAFDEVHGLGESFILRGEDEMDVVGHYDEGMEKVMLFGAVVLEGFEEEFGVVRDLKDAAAVVADGGDEEGALVGGSLRDSHWGSLVAGLAAVKDS
jgi:hypothetical protein